MTVRLTIASRKPSVKDNVQLHQLILSSGDTKCVRGDQVRAVGLVFVSAGVVRVIAVVVKERFCRCFEAGVIPGHRLA